MCMLLFLWMEPWLVNITVGEGAYFNCLAVRLVFVSELWLRCDFRQRHGECFRSVDVGIVFREVEGVRDGFEEVIVDYALPIG